MIPLNEFKRQWEDTRAPALEAFVAVGEEAWYILGRHVAEFEASLAARWQMQHATGVASGMDALEIALTIAGCKRGDRVLTTPLSAFATTLAIVRLGAVPVFVDTDRYGLIDLELCRKVLGARPEIRFVVPVHLYGNALDEAELRRLRDDFGVTVVEDCAQSIMATFDGRPTGAVGRLAATSFYPTKNLGAMGDGGAVLTNEAAADAAAKALRDYGQTAKYRHDHVGYNSRLDELHAALLLRAYLPRLERWTARRRAIAHRYLDGIIGREVQCLGTPPGSCSSWHLFPALVEPELKHDFMAHLRSRDVGCGEHYPWPIPRQRALADREFEVFGAVDTAERICGSEVSLPIHPYLTDEETARVIDACNTWKP